MHRDPSATLIWSDDEDEELVCPAKSLQEANQRALNLHEECGGNRSVGKEDVHVHYQCEHGIVVGTQRSAASSNGTSTIRSPHWVEVESGVCLDALFEAHLRGNAAVQLTEEVATLKQNVPIMVSSVGFEPTHPEMSKPVGLFPPEKKAWLHLAEKFELRFAVDAVVKVLGLLYQIVPVMRE